MNIAEILKHCPKGTKLYSLVHGEVTLEEVKSVGKYPIKIALNNKLSTYYSKDGLFFLGAGDCILFPSKEQRDWNKFRLPVKRGDIMMTMDKRAFIANGKIDNDGCPCVYCGINLFHDFTIGIAINGWTSSFYIPASEEAKKELFDKMKAAGYKWNADTLELEKIKPKFKEGDILINKNTNTLFLYSNNTFIDGNVPDSSLELASEEDRNKFYSFINKLGYKYDKEQHKLTKQTFKPFDKVLVRNATNEKWSINLFSYYDEENKIFPYVCLDGKYHHCVPYGGNEYLVGKTVN